MADEKKNMDISVYYANQEVKKFKEAWEEASARLDKVFAVEEANSKTLEEILDVVSMLKNAAKPVNYMKIFLSKQEACVDFLNEKGLVDEFFEFSQKPKE